MQTLNVLIPMTTEMDNEVNGCYESEVDIEITITVFRF
jgi:hypothetical protein